MLRKLTITIALAGLITSGLAYAGLDPQTGINGSWHDMNHIAGATKDKFGRTCVFCHTPHNAQTEGDGLVAPLWNRQTSAAPPIPYTWVTQSNLMKMVNGQPEYAIPFADDPLIGPSRLCLSCHDGSIAFDSHAPASGTTGAKMTSGRAHVSNLQITHPIGFKYSDAVAARGLGELIAASTGFLASPSASLTGTTFSTIDRSAQTYSSIKIQDTLYGAEGYMTCATCHEVHNIKNAVSDINPKRYNYFLRAREEGSAICLSCHVK